MSDEEAGDRTEDSPERNQQNANEHDDLLCRE